MAVGIYLSFVTLGVQCLLGAGPEIILQNGQPPQVSATGEIGDLLQFEASSGLDSSWDILSSFVLTNKQALLKDVWCGAAPKRFYRVSRSAANQSAAPQNFRLIDQAGKARELYYYASAPETKAIVLIFTANGCAQIAQQLPQINALRAQFEKQGVVFWMINSNPSDTRSAIAAEAKRLGITFPVLHDRAQTVARLYQARTAAEVVCINSGTLELVYQGALTDPTADDAATARNLASEAISAILAGSSYGIRQTKPPGCDVTVADAGALSYSQDIAPILQAKCVNCHSPGNIGPWAMTNHAMVQAEAAQMIQQISARNMPPWHADPEYGQFKGDISLTVAEERKLVQWLKAGAPRGEGPDPLETPVPPAPKWPVELGAPDLVIRAPEQHVIANGVEPYRYIFVDTGLTNDVWLKAAIVLPSNPGVVHHYLVWEGASMLQMAVGLAGYVPGSQRGEFPEGTGVLLHGNTQLTFNLHYTPDGTAGVDQPELALWFHKTPPAKSLITVPLLNTSFTIPPGARDYEVSAGLPFTKALPYAGTLYALSPHMHFRGSRMRFDVIYPDNTRETLLSVPNYQFHWQTRYQLAQPKKIPAGSKLSVVGAFDNSILNPENPDPDVAVSWGEQSFEEMFIGYLEFTQD